MPLRLAPAAQDAPRYNLSVAVDEVSLTFHATDAQGLPINDLKLDELRIFDNEKPPRKILAFQSLENFPIRAGFLLDTSDSVEGYLPRNRAISIEYAQQLLRQQTDQAFVMNFNYLAKSHSLGPTIRLRSLQAFANSPATAKAASAAQPSSPPSIKHVLTNSTKSITQRAETSSCSSRMGKTTPAGLI